MQFYRTSRSLTLFSPVIVNSFLVVSCEFFGCLALILFNREYGQPGRYHEVRIAVPVFDGRVSPVFDTARHILIVDIEDGSEVARTEHSLADLQPWQRARLLAEHEVSHLICGAISMPMMNLLVSHRITVTPNIAGYVDEVLRAYSSGVPFRPQFMMPGCCGRGGGRFRRGRGWRGV